MKNSRKYPTIIFDFDDTLLYRPTHINSIWEANLAALRLLSSNKLSLESLEKKLRKIYEKTTHKSAALTSKHEQFNQLLSDLETSCSNEELFDAYIKKYTSLVQLFPDVNSTLTTLLEHNIQLGIATNSPNDTVKHLVQHFNLTNFFHFIVTASELGFPKPSQEYSSFLEKQIKGWPVLLVGDGDEDLVTAKMIDAKFAYVSHATSSLSDQADYVLNDIKNILKIAL